MSSVASYAGRLVDLLAFQGGEAGREVLLDLELVDETTGGLLTAGIQKLAQRWLLNMLTERGSMPYQPTVGTSFMTDLRQGQIRTTVDAELSYALASSQARRNMLAEETDDTPDDEKIASDVLIALVVSGDTLTLRVRLVSLAGNSREVILPIDVRTG